MKINKLAADHNLLLAGLTTAERSRLMGDRAPVHLAFASILNEPGELIRHVHFPIDSSICLIARGEARSQVEVGLVGNEGMLGLPLLMGVNVSPVRMIVQEAGRAWRQDSGAFQRELAANTRLRSTLQRYLFVCQSQLMQTVVCARFHPVAARLARWLLMTRDRAHSNRFHVTHEFLAGVLGARRSGISTAANLLQKRNVIRYSRGDITILDDLGLAAAACVCHVADKALYRRILRTAARD